MMGWYKEVGMHGYFRRFIHCCGVFAEMMYSAMQITYGAWRVSVLPRPIVTIFGGSRWQESSPYAHQARELAQLLVQHDISVLHGGGPGIMEAVARGGLDYAGKATTLGIGVRSLNDKSKYIKDYFDLKFFFERKWLMTRYSVGFIFFPGGLGTFDELGEVLTLIQTKQLSKVPIILVGKDYWKPLIEWIDEMLKYGLITPEHKDLFVVSDDVQRVLSLVCKECTAPREPVKKV
ncbi:MAG TPA: TIGR00730 family Rossman fold protein [Candidatus Limnocylindria bacterium]|nr:TIGR00730 family Rossman fold protein [Candidatus Limnocylindria bacterium]